MSLSRKLARLEDYAAETFGRRWAAALDALGPTMLDEHREQLAAWSARPEVQAEYRRRPQGALLDVLARLQPPALVRAALLLIVSHIHAGTPLTLPDYVADVYLEDPLAVPLHPCATCGYALPVQATIRPDGSIAYTGVGYFGPCPVCAGYRNGQADD